MANAIIFHGTGGLPTYCWYPWLAARLAARGYEVELPHYPELNVEPIQTFLPKVLARHVFNEVTVLVGQSGGAALLLALLEHLDTRVGQVVLVAGYSTRRIIRKSPSCKKPTTGTRSRPTLPTSISSTRSATRTAATRCRGVACWRG